MIAYRPEIDGLRAVAVVAVVLYHAGLAGFTGGFVGVDVFFVISGYLITSIILAQEERGLFSLSNFYERRARRIFPALFVTVLLCLPAAWILLPPEGMRDFAQSVAAVPFFSTNMLFWREAGYFDGAADLKPLLHTWSLAAEEQFYLVYPILLLVARRLSTPLLSLTLLLLIAAGLVIAEWGAVHAQNAAFFTLPFRAWELAVGAWLALHFPPSAPPKFGSFARRAGSVMGFAMIAFAIFAYDTATPFPGIYAALPVVGAALTIACSHPDTTIGRTLACRPVVALGLMSYGAYLFHKPLMAFVRHAAGPKAEGLPMLLVSGLSFALAYFSWKHLELPCRDRKRVGRKVFFSASVAFAAIFIAFGAIGHNTDGFIFQRLTPDQTTILTSAKSSPVRERCHTGGPDFRSPTRACVLGQGHRKAAIFGDSHTVELAYALTDELKKDGLQVIQHSFSGCPPSLGPTRGEHTSPCADWSAETLDLIVHDDAIDLVVVSYKILAYAKSDIETSSTADSWKTLLDLLQYLNTSGKQVVFVLQAPKLPASIQDLVFRSGNPTEDILGQSRAEWEKQRQFLTSRIHEVPREVMIVDPTEIFCDSRVCNATKDGIALYFDNNHVSVSGARLIAKEVSRRVAKSLTLPHKPEVADPNNLRDGGR